MAFTIALATVVGLLFSVAPAWRVGACVDRCPPCSEARGRRRAAAEPAGLLVAVQVGLSLVLLINAGLLVRSLQEIRAVDSGMRTDDVFVVYPDAKPGGYQGVDHDSYYPAVLQRLAAIPECANVSVSLFKPAAGGGAAPEPVSRVAAARWFIRACRPSGRRCRRGSSTRWVCRCSPAAISTGAITRAAGALR